MQESSEHTTQSGAPISHRKSGGSIGRSTFFRAAAGVGLAAGAGVLFGVPQSRDAVVGLASSDDKGAKAATSTKIGDLTGPGLTDGFRMASTDLGIPVNAPDGGMLFVFGDTYEGAHGPNPDDNWRSPTALYSGDLDGRVTWTEAVGGDTARQLWPYEHTDDEFTVLPSDALVIGDTIYLHAMANKPLGNVIGTELWKSTNNGADWQQVATFPADFRSTQNDPNPFQLITWGLGDNDWVYIYSTEFGREMGKMYHFRVHKNDIENPDRYESWGAPDGEWGWGKDPTPVLEDRPDAPLLMGEMCLRPIDGKWVLTFFNAHADNSGIEGMVMDRPDADLTQVYREMLIHNTSWGNEDDSHVAQVYGGYIIPGSSLSTLHLSVSQWNTDTDNEELDPGWPYRVMQFRIDGFGT